MTFEQWAEEMKKGISPQINDKRKSPIKSHDHSNWELEEEESPNFPSDQN